MRPPNHLNYLIDEGYQPLKNKTDISLTKILGGKVRWNKACVGKKIFLIYKMLQGGAPKWPLRDLVSGIESAANLLCDLGLVLTLPGPWLPDL